MKFSEGGQFENAPSGAHAARCIRLIDLGTQVHTWNNDIKHKRDVLIAWELPETMMEGIYNPDMKGKPFVVRRVFTASLAPNANLKAVLESWRGKKFTKEELATFEPKSILGKPCLLNLVESDDGQYVNVDSVSPLPKGMVCPKASNSQVFFSLEENEFTAEAFGKLPESLRSKISQSPEFKALMGKQSTDQEQPGDEGPPEADESF